MNKTLISLTIALSFAASAQVTQSTPCPAGASSCTGSNQSLGDVVTTTNSGTTHSNAALLGNSTASNASGVTITPAFDNRAQTTQNTSANISGGNTASNALGNSSSNTLSAAGGAGGSANQQQSMDRSGNSANLNAQNNASNSGGNSLSNGSSSGASSTNAGNTVKGEVKGGNNTSTQANSVTVNGDTVVYEAQERNPVATAYSAPLTSTNGTCMGSTSGGAQGVGFGISFGSTWSDTSCDLRYDAEALRAAGLPKAAQARLCQKAEIAKAMEAAGTPCPAAKKVATAQ